MTIAFPTIASGVLDTIGGTPLIRLNRASALTGCEILGKAEFMNPGASVKDRAALFMIRDAEAKGLIRPGGRIVEGTAGNTGIGLAMVAKALGYNCTIVIPRNQSQEKKDAVRLYGAELVEVDPVPYANDMNYVKVSHRLANQFDNVANREAHMQGTGPEIWAQTGGEVDGFICAIGSGGTLAGVAQALRARKPDVAIGLADPDGSALYGYYTTGELKAEGTSLTEGIGQGRLTANFESLKIDHAYRIPDSELLPVVYDLLEHEGLLMGGSTGINVAGAMRLARDLGPGKTIVTVLCDGGQRYQSKIFNPDFLKERGLPTPPWMA
jgi:cysteine synthase A